jgi:hypothetical protein
MLADEQRQGAFKAGILVLVLVLILLIAHLIAGEVRSTGCVSGAELPASSDPQDPQPLSQQHTGPPHKQLRIVLRVLELHFTTLSLLSHPPALLTISNSPPTDSTISSVSAAVVPERKQVSNPSTEPPTCGLDSIANTTTPLFPPSLPTFQP